MLTSPVLLNLAHDTRQRNADGASGVMCRVLSLVLSVGWPLGVVRLLSRPLQEVSRGSLVDISSCSGLLWGQQANLWSVLLFLRVFCFLSVISVFKVI
jgi:hypothetical protein